MSDKIKFIVDDLANYSGDLLSFSDYILYLPKKIELNGTPIETQPSYSSDFLNAVENGYRINSALMESERYQSILEGFLADYPDYDFIYVKPWTCTVFNSDIENAVSIMSELNSTNNNRIHIFSSDSFGPALHFIILNLIKQYINNELSVNDLETLFEDLNSNTYLYIR